MTGKNEFFKVRENQRIDFELGKIAIFEEKTRLIQYHLRFEEILGVTVISAILLLSEFSKGNL